MFIRKKKTVFAIVLTAILSVQSFAQEIPNAVFVDFGTTISGVLLGGFGIGLGYERGLSDYISVMISAAYIGFVLEGETFGSYTRPDTIYTGISVGAHARVYPLADVVRRWFIDVGGNYSHITIEFGDKADSDLFEIGAVTGWKFVFGDSSGFFLEPGLGYTFVFGDINTPLGSADIPATDGFRLWLGLGWAF
ncbi:MAG: hypothetical protein LBB22_04350 [Treponema sp.]|jgi:hypothetical protein|nr:hypothetical protein [Treponema sp.]